MLNIQESEIFDKKIVRNGYTEIEVKRMEKMKNELSVSYWRQDNFITAIITHNDMGVISVGVVKRNPIDMFSEEMGIKYSFVRAIDNYKEI